MVFISIVLITQILHTMHNKLTLSAAISRRPLNRSDCLVNRSLDQLNLIEEKRAMWSSSRTTETLDYCLVRSFIHSFAHLHHHSTSKTEIHTNNYWNIMNVLSSSRDIQHASHRLISSVRVNVSLALLLLSKLLFCVSIWCDAAIDFKLLMWLPI